MDLKNEKHVNMQLVDLNNHRFAVEILSGNASVNLTQMAKPYGSAKKPDNWLRLDETKDYLDRLSVSQKCATLDLVKVKRGGASGMQGTWCYDYRIAMRFAQWLSTDFAIAVDELLVRLLTRQAIFTQDFNGVPPVASGGKLWYNYLDVLVSLGYSRKSGSVSKRRKLTPWHFAKFYGRNFITMGYCNYLKQRRESAQLTFNFLTA